MYIVSPEWTVSGARKQSNIGDGIKCQTVREVEEAARLELLTVGVSGLVFPQTSCRRQTPRPKTIEQHCSSTYSRLNSIIGRYCWPSSSGVKVAGHYCRPSLSPPPSPAAPSIVGWISSGILDQHHLSIVRTGMNMALCPQPRPHRHTHHCPSVDGLQQPMVVRQPHRQISPFPACHLHHHRGSL